MKKLFWIMHDLEFGGAESMTIQLLPAFVDAGYDVTLFLVRTGGGLFEKLDPRVRLISPDAASLRRGLRPLAEALRTVRPDVVVSNLTHLNLAAILTARLLRLDAALIVIEHSTPSLNNTQSIKERSLASLASLAYRLADRVVAVSQGAAEDILRMMRLPAAKVAVVYNPIDADAIRAQAEEPTGIDAIDQAETPLIVAVGRLERQKNFSFLIRAFRLVRDRRDCRLVLVGDGSEAAELKRLAAELKLADDVLFPGFQANPFAFIARANVLSCSSEYEGFNRTIAEALTLGTPVVSVDCPSGPAEILANGVYGRLTPVGELNAFADALLAALGPIPAEERARLRARGNDFSVGRIFMAMENVIQSASGDR